MSLEHLKPFLEAMGQGDTDSLAAHLAEDVFLRSPIVVKQFEGKGQVLEVLKALLSIIDRFEVTDTLIGDTHVAAVLKIKVGDIEVEGVDYIAIDKDGLIKSMVIQWRPLPLVVAIQQKLAPVIGIPALKLVEA